jgi:hypothetical protein
MDLVEAHRGVVSQVHLIVNLDRREYICPLRVGDAGCSLAEMMGGHALDGLSLLLAASSKGLRARGARRGGGDFAVLNIDHTWDGTGIPCYEPVNALLGMTIPELEELAGEFVGRWTADRVALIGDYLDDADRRGGAVPLFDEVDSTFTDISVSVRTLLSAGLWNVLATGDVNAT